ncbi:ureidoglycolate hydrolase [Xylariales sp. PMI_506]|nr:ureidoglycolate hydrolase [Xylariales sp. PMI_506]
MIVDHVAITESLELTAMPLTRELFAPFGSVVRNPRPTARPQNTDPKLIDTGILPYGAISANRGTGIQYRDIAPTHNLYDQAPSKIASSPRMTLFVCAAQELTGPHDDSTEVQTLERHPFTTQTFIPLGTDASKRYLVIVAPTLQSENQVDRLPVPISERHNLDLPGSGLPDLSGIKAFIATNQEAITYGAGTWHAPMVVLGQPDDTIDFIIVQFGNGVALEDCQEVSIRSRGSNDSKISVRISDQSL